MLTPPPDVSIEDVAGCLADAYGVRASEIVFLPLGADANTAVYRVEAAGGERYFLKLRGGDFDGRSVVLPRFLQEHGIVAVIPPIETHEGGLSAKCGRFSVILSPFVDGANGFARPLTDAQWIELGRTLAAMHSLALPHDVEQCVPRETYTARWRDDVRRELDAASPRRAAGPALDELLLERRTDILHLVERASLLADVLRGRPQAFVLCHGDIHAGNVLIDDAGQLHVVDWDDAWLAPKERDLMFIGAGIGRAWNEKREEALFYQGYGDVTVDPAVVAYYRYERIVQDFASYVSEIRERRVSDEDALKGVGKLASAFGPNDVIEIARRADDLIP